MSAPGHEESHRPPGLLLPCLLVFTIALVIRAVYATLQPVPISADAAYYIAVAENLYHGRGLTIDYVWNYLGGVPDALPVPSNTYWLPGQSIVVAGAFALARSTSLRVAQAPGLVLGGLLCALTAWTGGLLFRRRDVALISGLMAAVSIHLSGVALFPDHFMLAAVLVNMSLLALWAAWWRDAPAVARNGGGKPSDPSVPRIHLLLIAGLLAGLACLTRNDGVLLALPAAALTAALLRRRQTVPALLTALAYGAGALAVLAPWLVRQKHALGSYGGVGAWRTAFLTDYNDLFRLDLSALNLRDYLQTSQTFAAMFKAFVLYKELHLLIIVVGVAGLLAVLALANGGLRRTATPWLIYLGAALLVPAFVVPYPTIKGGFWHLLPGLCPIIFALAAGRALQLLWQAEGTSGAVRRAAARLALPLTFAYLLAWWSAAPREIEQAKIPLYPAVARIAVGDIRPDMPVVTDSSWGVHHVTHLPCAQFPSDGAEAALAVADRLGAEYLFTMADAPDQIPAIAEVVNHPRFQPLRRYPTDGSALLVYRIMPEPNGSPPAPG